MRVFIKTVKNYKQISRIIVLSFIGLLSINTSFAGSYYNNNHEYRSGSHRAQNKHRSTVTIDYGYSDTHRAPRHAERRRYSHERRSDSYRPAHQYNSYRSHTPRYQQHSRNYYNSVSYSSYNGHNNAAATIVGGAIGGVIANDISGGDGAATAIGILGGAVLASGLSH